MQPVLATAPSSGVPAGATAKKRAEDMNDRDWEGIEKFFREEALEDEHAEDASDPTAPRTLYVNRPLKNGAALAEWARKAGIKGVLPPGDMHVTLAFSRSPLAWPEADNRATLEVGSANARKVDRLGDSGEAVVLRFESPEMWKRWDQLRSLGASWDFPEYRPHVTVAYDDSGADFGKVEPFDGPLEFGPEEFAEVDPGWKEKVKKKIAGDEAPRSLYASRRLANAEELLDWARDVGFKKRDLLDPADVRVVFGFSDDPLQWPERNDAGLTVPAADVNGNGTRWVAPSAGGAALRFDSPDLMKRWWQLREAGASWDMGRSEPFQPQVVFASDPGDLDLSQVEPFDGALNFGPEEFRPTADEPDAGRRDDASAGIMFVSPKGKVLFLRRASFGVHHPGEWDFPGGGLEGGEDAEQAARRESKEEIGHDLGLPVRLVDVVDAGDGVEYAAFAMEVPKRFKPALSDEHVSYLWAHPHDAPAPLHPGLSGALGKLVGEGLADREAGRPAADVEPRPHGAGVMVVTPSGEALFMLRGGGGDHEGEWCFPGGRVDAGEEARDAAGREAGEETGNMSLELSEHPLDRRTIGGKDFATYLAKADRYPVQMNHEHVDYKWAPLSNPPSPLHPGVEATLQRLAGLEAATSRDTAVDATFEESKHHRDSGGKFSSSGGEGGVGSGWSRQDLDDYAGREEGEGGGSGWSAAEMQHYGDEATGADAGWEEGKHPRDKGGEFTSKGGVGGGSSGEVPQHLNKPDIHKDPKRFGAFMKNSSALPAPEGSLPVIINAGQEFRGTKYFQDHPMDISDNYAKHVVGQGIGRWPPSQETPGAGGGGGGGGGDLPDEIKTAIANAAAKPPEKRSPGEKALLKQAMGELPDEVKTAIADAAAKPPERRTEGEKRLLKAAMASAEVLRNVGGGKFPLTVGQALGKKGNGEIDHPTYPLPDKPGSVTVYNLPHGRDEEQQWMKVRRNADGSYYGYGESFDFEAKNAAEARAKLQKWKATFTGMDAADAALPNGELSETTREDIGEPGSEKRGEMPDDVFLEPASKKYPIKEKRDGGWAYTEKLLLAAARRARLNGKPEIAARADAIRAKEFGAPSGHAGDSALKIAFDDKASVRRFDRDGRMHVDEANICKACVSPYRGEEIPGWQELNLDPEKVYHLLRDPDEIAKAAESANGIQILQKHVPVDADDHKPYDIVGATGSSVRWADPYLKNSLHFWTAPSIADIESEEKRELSPGYHYRPDMTPGKWRGENYDGVMRDIVFNHVAQVKDGRQGKDVVVGDSALDLGADWDAVEALFSAMVEA